MASLCWLIEKLLPFRDVNAHKKAPHKWGAFLWAMLKSEILSQEFASGLLPEW